MFRKNGVTHQLKKFCDWDCECASAQKILGIELTQNFTKQTLPTELAGPGFIVSYSCQENVLAYEKTLCRIVPALASNSQ